MTRRGDRGFTLIEVLVALLILSVAVVAVLQLFGGGLRLARTSGDHLAATLLASAKLSELTLEALEEGVTEGTEGDFRWTRRVSLEQPAEPEPPAPTQASGPQPRTTQVTLPAGTVVRVARLAVEVQWAQNRRVELVTLRTWSAKR